MVARASERWQKTGNEGDYGVFEFEGATLKIRNVAGFPPGDIHLDRRFEIDATLHIPGQDPIVCANREQFGQKMDELELPLYLNAPAEETQVE